MANQISKKYIGDNQIDQNKILLDNNTGLKSSNAAGNAEVDLIKLNSSNEVVITGLKAPSVDSDASTKKYVDDAVNNGGQSLQNHIDDSTGAHEATAIAYSNSTTLMAATQVQAAIDELHSTKLNLSGGTMSGNINMNANNINNVASPTQNGQPLIYDQLGAANGVVPLNGSSKIESTYLPSYVDDVLEYANLAAFPVTGEAGKIYVALDNGKVYRWGGSAYFEVSPSEVNSVNGATGIVVLDTDDISEGSSNKYYSESLFNSSFSGKDTDDLSEGTSNLYYTQARFDSALSAKDTDDLSEGTTNKYFTEQRAKDAAVSDTAYGAGWDGVNDVAPSKNAVYDEMQLAKGRLDSLEAVSAQVFKKTLDGTDITNAYIDLPYLAIQTNDFHVFVDRLALHQGAGEDYTLSTVSGVTRITFLNDMLSGGNQPLASGDSIYVRYKK